MNREFLKKLDLSDDAIEKIMAEHGKAVKTIEATLEELETLKSEKSNLEKSLKAVNRDNESLSGKYAELTNQHNEILKEHGSLKTRDLKLSVAIKNNIPLDLADRLMGDDEESLQADAERFAGFVAPKPEPLPMKNNDITEDSNGNNASEDQAYQSLASIFETSPTE